MFRLLYSNLEYVIIILSNQVGPQSPRLFSFAEKITYNDQAKGDQRKNVGRFCFAHLQKKVYELAWQFIYFGDVYCTYPKRR